jgi:Holliday junction DNA helicase RuvA
MFVSGVGQEAISALVILGFSKQASEKAVAKIVKDSPSLSLEVIIKEALKRM